MGSQSEHLNEGLKYVARYKKAMPDIASARTAMDDMIFEDGELPRYVKELIAVGSSSGIGCEICMLSHTRKALESGATVQQIMEALAVTISIEGGYGLANASRAVQLLEELGKL